MTYEFPSINPFTAAAKAWLPPVLAQKIRECVFSPFWYGDFKSWADAKARTTGYEDGEILRRVRASALAVKAGEIAFELDSTRFVDYQFNWELVASLQHAALRSGTALDVVDFGGSLGSSYFQHKPLLANIGVTSWQVVEQPHFVRCGQAEIAEGNLSFAESLEETRRPGTPQTLLLSGVLQCLEDPWAFIGKAIGMGFNFIIVDRTGFNPLGGDRLTIQRVPKRIYRASYPCWFFDQPTFERHFATCYSTVFRFKAQDRANIPSIYRGFLFERKAGL